MNREELAHGSCVDCEQPVMSGQGVTVDADQQVWHTDCRKVFLRKQRTATEQEPAKRGPGRPRKEAVA